MSWVTRRDRAIPVPFEEPHNPDADSIDGCCSHIASRADSFLLLLPRVQIVNEAVYIGIGRCTGQTETLYIRLNQHSMRSSSASSSATNSCLIASPFMEPQSKCAHVRLLGALDTPGFTRGGRL
eukprot:1183818-Prorocentrum_minimum.AAC.2